MSTQSQGNLKPACLYILVINFLFKNAPKNLQNLHRIYLYTEQIRKFTRIIKWLPNLSDKNSLKNWFKYIYLILHYHRILPSQRNVKPLFSILSETRYFLQFMGVWLDLLLNSYTWLACLSSLYQINYMSLRKVYGLSKNSLFLQNP